MRAFASIAKFVCGTLLGLSVVNSSAQSEQLPLRQIAPNVFELGSVRLDKEKRTVRFPTTINMTNGLVEYMVVNGTGKLHESILKTEAEPSRIHLAMLFLGAKDASTNASATEVAGEKITVEISWKSGNKQKQSRAENFVFNSETKTTMSNAGWIYNGSKVIDGTFIAQRDGSILSIISDPLALANSRQPDRDNDEIWNVNTNLIPPLNTAVEVTFKLEWPPKSTEGRK